MKKKLKTCFFITISGEVIRKYQKVPTVLEVTFSHSIIKLNSRKMSMPTRQDTGVGVQDAREVHEADERMDHEAGACAGGIGGVNREVPQLDLSDVNVAKAMLLAYRDETATLFGVRFIEALEDDELRQLARLSVNWQAGDFEQFADYTIALEEVTGIEHTGELTDRGRRALALLQECEIVDDDKEMSARIRFLLKWGFEPAIFMMPVNKLVVAEPFTNKYGFDRFRFVTDMYYDPHYFSHDEMTGKVNMWYDEEDGKHLSRYTWDRAMPSFCTLKAECRCSLCLRCNKTDETRRRFPQAMRERFRRWALSAAEHRWNQNRKRGNDNKAAGETNHVIFGRNADHWLVRHDMRSHEDKEEIYESYAERRCSSMYFAGRYVRTPFWRTRTIRVSGFPANIALYEIQAIVGQVTGVIDVRRPVDAAGKPASFVEVVVPGRFRFRQMYQVLNILRSSPIVIRGHALQFLADNEESVPVQGPAAQTRGGAGGPDQGGWTAVGGGGGGHRGGGASGGGRTSGGGGGHRSSGGGGGPRRRY